jgi:uncharacterized protein (TIGR02996 family)
MLITDKKTEEMTFVRAIIAAPDDNAPRLIFADWLQEQGYDDRAEFIRLQIAMEPEPHNINSVRSFQFDEPVFTIVDNSHRLNELLQRNRLFTDVPFDRMSRSPKFNPMAKLVPPGAKIKPNRNPLLPLTISISYGSAWFEQFTEIILRPLPSNDPFFNKWTSLNSVMFRRGFPHVLYTGLPYWCGNHDKLLQTNPIQRVYLQIRTAPEMFLGQYNYFPGDDIYQWSVHIDRSIFTLHAKMTQKEFSTWRPSVIANLCKTFPNIEFCTHPVTGVAETSKFYARLNPDLPDAGSLAQGML